MAIFIEPVEADCCIAGSKSMERDLSREPANPHLLPQDELGKHITHLMMLHPELVRFRCKDLDAMNEPTKLQLLADMNRALGIRLPENGNR